jgi:hypothetical protein
MIFQASSKDMGPPYQDVFENAQTENWQFAGYR